MKFVAIILLNLIFAGSSFAALYKWIDENGKVHYTDQLPEGQSAKEIQPEPGPTPEEIERAQKQLEVIRNDLEQASATREVKCSRLRRMLTNLSKPGPAVLQHKDGRIITVTGTNKEKLIRGIEERIRELCK